MARALVPVALTTLDTMFVDVPISAVDADRAPVDLSAATPKLAFMPRGTQPADDDWHPAVWNDDATAAGLLIGPGPGGQVYAAGRYVAWWTVTVPGGDEIPARPAPAPGAAALLTIQET